MLRLEGGIPPADAGAVLVTAPIVGCPFTPAALGPGFWGTPALRVRNSKGQARSLDARAGAGREGLLGMQEGHGDPVLLPGPWLSPTLGQAGGCQAAEEEEEEESVLAAGSAPSSGQSRWSDGSLGSRGDGGAEPALPAAARCPGLPPRGPRRPAAGKCGPSVGGVLGSWGCG